MGVLDKIEAASPASRVETICLNRALQAQYDELMQGMEDAAVKDAQDASLGDTQPNLRALIDKMDVVRGAMLDSQVQFTVTQMGWTERVALQAKHPPRPDNPIDRFRGFNAETFIPDLIKKCVSQIEDNDGDVETDISDATWDKLFKSLNYGGVNRLFVVASEVNDEDAQIPTSARSLLVSQDSGASLAQPEPGPAPRPSGSGAGSRPTQRRSSTAKKAPAKKTASSAT